MAKANRKSKRGGKRGPGKTGGVSSAQTYVLPSFSFSGGGKHDFEHIDLIFQMFTHFQKDEVEMGAQLALKLEALGVSILALRLAAGPISKDAREDLFYWAWNGKALRSLLWLTDHAFEHNTFYREGFFAKLPYWVDHYRKGSEELRIATLVYTHAAARLANSGYDTDEYKNFMSWMGPNARTIMSHEVSKESALDQRDDLANDVPDPQPMDGTTPSVRKSERL